MEWISVKDRLPDDEDDGQVMAWDAEYFIPRLIHPGDVKIHMDITHWLEVEPPEDS